MAVPAKGTASAAQNRFADRRRDGVSGREWPSACPGGGRSLEQEPDSRRRAMLRLCSLNEESQERIAKKYYHGFRPWQEAR